MDRGMSSRKGLRSGPSWAARSLHTLSATLRAKKGSLVSRDQVLLFSVKLVGSWKPTSLAGTGRGQQRGEEGKGRGGKGGEEKKGRRKGGGETEGNEVQTVREVSPRQEVEVFEERIGKACRRAYHGTRPLLLGPLHRLGLHTPRRARMLTSAHVEAGEGHDSKGAGAAESRGGRGRRVSGGTRLSPRAAPTRRRSPARVRAAACACAGARRGGGGRSGGARGAGGAGDALGAGPGAGAGRPDEELVVTEALAARRRALVAAGPRPVAPQAAAAAVVAGVVQEIGEAWLRRGSGGHVSRRWEWCLALWLLSFAPARGGRRDTLCSLPFGAMPRRPRRCRRGGAGDASAAGWRRERGGGIRIATRAKMMSAGRGG